MAEQVDAADLKSVVRKDVPVRVWLGAPILRRSFGAFFVFELLNFVCLIFLTFVLFEIYCLLRSNIKQVNYGD